MSGFSIFLLVLQSILFPIWMILAFRWLFALRADAVRQSGNAMPGPRWTIRTFRNGLTDGRHAKDRVRLGLLTVAQLALSVLHALE